MMTFNPVKYSREENAFLLENAGKPPVVALRGPVPEGVNPRAVRPVLQEIYDRDELQRAEGVEWRGVDAVKDAITTWLREDRAWEDAWLKTRGRRPRWPSLYVRDAKGKYHMGAPGSDSVVSHWIDERGDRHPFELPLDIIEDDVQETFVIRAAPKALIENPDVCRIECPICQHTESYKSNSRISVNAARRRMHKHLLRTDVDEVDLHRELAANEFGTTGSV